MYREQEEIINRTEDREMDINITFCRTLLGLLRKDLEPLGIRVNKDAAILDAGFGQWFFETNLPHPTRHTEEFKIYVEGHNAYDARANGWYKYLELLEDARS